MLIAFLFNCTLILTVLFKGLTEEQIKGVLTASKQVEIKVDGNEYTISSGMGTRTYPLSKEIDEKLPDGKSMKVKFTFLLFKINSNNIFSITQSTASVTGNQFIVSSVGNDGKKGKRVYEVSDSGLKLVSSCK